MTQKIDTALALSLDVSEEIRKESRLLAAGVDEETKVWQVILRYTGREDNIRENCHKFIPVTGGFGVAWSDREEIKQLALLPQVIYMEKPAELSYEVADGIDASCIRSVYHEPFELNGEDVIVGVIDSGLDIFHPDFRREDGSTRVLEFWDQGADNPDGMGVVYKKSEINSFLAEGSAPFADPSGHGTHVTGIAAGNGRASNGLYRGVAWDSELLIVKTGRSGKGQPQTAELMLAVDYCCRIAREAGKPLALNISYGTSYGAHNGRTILDEYIRQIALYGKQSICIGSGNEGNAGRHKRVILGEDPQTAELVIASGERNVGIYLYGFWQDDYDILLEHPSGEQFVLSSLKQGSFYHMFGGTQLVMYGAPPSPYETMKKILFELVPSTDRNFIPAGIWKMTFIPRKIKSGIVDMWLPSGTSVSTETFFHKPTLSQTITLPGMADAAITVGAYDARTKTYAGFSGRGSGEGEFVKPNLVAPGVDIISCSPGGGYTAKTGTSMACPFVTGAAALMMQWGIVKGNDRYLYGNKLKAALQGSAASLSAGERYPNNETGWGALCVREALKIPSHE